MSEITIWTNSQNPEFEGSPLEFTQGINMPPAQFLAEVARWVNALPKGATLVLSSDEREEGGFPSLTVYARWRREVAQ